MSKPGRPIVQIDHKSQEIFQPNKPLSISLETANNPERVLLHYRHVNQSEYWKSIELMKNATSFTGEIPAAFTNNRFPLQYYFEIETGHSEAILYPPLAHDLANVPYFVIHSNKQYES
jgi:hypothetical protein